jgi:hypothetical protein
MTFEIVNSFGESLDEALETFREDHPQMGDTHEKVFRYAYVKGWETLKDKIEEYIKSLEE